MVAGGKDLDLHDVVLQLLLALSLNDFGCRQGTGLLVFGLVDFAEGAVSQLAHDLPYVVGVQVPADMLVFTGLSLLEGG